MEELKYKYRYAVLRYVPDFATDEFINAGILFYDATTNTVRTKLIEDIERLKSFAPKSDYQFFLKYAKMLTEEIKKTADSAKKKGGMTVSDIIDGAFKRLTTPDSGMLTFSDIKGGVTDNLNEEFNEIFGEYISSKTPEKRNRTHLSTSLAASHVYAIIDRLRSKLKKMPYEKSFHYPVTEGTYKCEVSFNSEDKVYLKVLSLRTVQNYAYEIQNILSAVTVLSDLRKLYKGAFGGLIYFSPKYSQPTQAAEFARLKERFAHDKLDCIKSDEKSMLQYFKNKHLLT